MIIYYREYNILSEIKPRPFSDINPMASTSGPLAGNVALTQDLTIITILFKTINKKGGCLFSGNFRPIDVQN